MKLPEGASGSLTISASDLTEGGTLLQASAGDLSSPEQVNLTGMCVLLVKAELLSLKLLCARADLAIVSKAGAKSAIRR